MVLAFISVIMLKFFLVYINFSRGTVHKLLHNYFCPEWSTFLLLEIQVDDILETKLGKRFQLVLDKGTLDAIGLHPDGPVKR